jgi:hypothetical protein
MGTVSVSSCPRTRSRWERPGRRPGSCRAKSPTQRSGGPRLHAPARIGPSPLMGPCPSSLWCEAASPENRNFLSCSFASRLGDERNRSADRGEIDDACNLPLLTSGFFLYPARSRGSRREDVCVCCPVHRDRVHNEMMHAKIRQETYMGKLQSAPYPVTGTEKGEGESRCLHQERW